ncbi:FecR domain-containing protein [Parabacteroides sp. PF5-9]|uniref:FecR family protein n=1 Tax=Parabacteroides sp. PF5-9 TaxID=1742404 RepID=UPI0024742A94|nr:FecR domain-containing protein [Parabacteroides sp. PF5-9]MDH6358558.1 ferric-dicitrate binding protein FerR (iron transport regulator) [Parabacteroides sp. PF5-9]
MNQTRQEKMKTDQAWEQLYARLEQEDLLNKHADKKSQRLFSIRSVTWAAAIALLCITGISVYLNSVSDEANKMLLTLQNSENAVTLVTTLEDGSIVYLDNNSQLQYPEHFADEKREVALQGNALFEISGNRERPFLIETADVYIKVIGTSFNVRCMENEPFKLAVRQGEVEVTLRQTNETIAVKAGQTVTLISDNLQLSHSSDNDEFRHYTSRIRFKDEKLTDLLNVINKNEANITILAEPSLADRRITITFEENSPEEMVELICLGLNLKYTRDNNYLTLSQP